MTFQFFLNQRIICFFASAVLHNKDKSHAEAREMSQIYQPPKLHSHLHSLVP